MKNRVSLLFTTIVGVLFFGFFFVTDALAAPSITSVTPERGKQGTVVTIVGSGFASTGNTIKLGSYTLGSSYSSTNNGTKIQFNAPSPSGTAGGCLAQWCLVEVVNSGGTSRNSIGFVLQYDPPAITNVRTTNLTQTGAQIRWDTTGVYSTGEVYYSTTFPVDINSATKVEELRTNLYHLVGLSQLNAGTTYYYLIRSRPGDNQGGGEHSSVGGSFTTAVNTTPDYTSNLRELILILMNQILIRQPL